MAIDEENVTSLAKDLVDEIGHLMTVNAVRTIAGIIRTPLIKIMNGIHINKKGLELVSN